MKNNRFSNLNFSNPIPFDIKCEKNPFALYNILHYTTEIQTNFNSNIMQSFKTSTRKRLHTNTYYTYIYTENISDFLHNITYISEHILKLNLRFQHSVQFADVDFKLGNPSKCGIKPHM